MLSEKRAFMVTKEVVRKERTIESIRENKVEHLKDRRDTSNQEDQVHIKKEEI